ncbi:conjugal transfer mating pair stabilization protein TraN [Pseudomonas aeruginosa]|uniref:conjugal transfer mating pair stabilization protein TraN n=1 Tax=Pseudomonas aeruginosa TaxID=287 RepID=UPI001E5E49CD|nr:conjugal transfer mating pair stabilization protein TraN [Pseudomonas aeruginosa]MCC9289620.1 conjugal transfer mating pair stabilization protein TraN [Pseudomonas aeruginosa]
MRQPLNTTLRRLVNVTVIGLYLNSMTLTAWADAVTAGSAAGQTVGQQALQVFDGGDASVTLQDLFPETGDSASLENVYGVDVKTIDLGLRANTRHQSESSSEGEAYRSLIDSGNRMSVDLCNDPMLNQPDQVRSPDFMDGLKQNFADCTSTEDFENVTKNAQVANYKTGERVVDQGGNVEFLDDYKVGVIEYVSGQANFQSCGPGCLYISVGTVGDYYWSGNCKIYEEYTRFRVIAKDAIISATVDRADFDDYFQILFNDEMLWTHTPGVFPPVTAGSCERGTSWNVAPNKVITDKFRSDDDVITFKTRTSVTGGGEGYARIKNIYDPAKPFVDIGWGPEERLPMIDMIEDGFCTNAQMSCTSKPAVDANGCTVTNGVRICRSDMPASPHPSIDPLCEKAQVSAECSYYKGNMDCYTDGQGVQRCPSNDGANLNTCTQNEQNPSCGFISQGCIDGAKGETGSCYGFEEVWHCGYETSYETIVNTRAQIECAGGARCMGSECFDSWNTKSGDFAYAVGMLQVAQFAEHDLDCGGDGTDIYEANDCKVFNGEAMECEKALGGYVDCSEAPESVSIFDYVILTMNSLKMTSSLEALSRTGNLFAPGYCAAGTEAALSVGSSDIKGRWGTIVDSATAAFNERFQGAAMGQIQHWLMQQGYDAMVEMGACAAAIAVFGTGAEGSATQGTVTALSANAAMVVNMIGWVYMVYVIVDLVINIISECEQMEFELGAKKESRQCHFDGSYCACEALGSCVDKREAYCCFGSVVAGIIQESARDQLGFGWGDVKSATCEGFTPAQMAHMDWSRVDLSEWNGMLNLAGGLPTANTDSLEDITRSGSKLQSTDGVKRLNTLDRNVQRLDNFDVDAVNRKAEEGLR